MCSLREDLDRFLKTDGARIIMNSDRTRVKPYQPPVIDGYGTVSEIDPEDLDEDSLKDLLVKAQNLQSELEEQLSDTEDLIDRILDHLDEPDE